MSNHKDQRPDLVAALKRHHLAHDTPSQLSDAFRLGWDARAMTKETIPAVAMGKCPANCREGWLPNTPILNRYGIKVSFTSNPCPHCNFRSPDYRGVCDD